MSLLKIARIFFSLAILLSALLGCASYQSNLSPIQQLISNGKAKEAADKLREKAFKEGDDQVVYLLEYGTAMQLAGDYQESNKAFLLAEGLTEVKNYHSVSRITGSLLSSARLIQYKGEDYEKVLINAMLAINYLMLGHLEDAMVETRKLNDKLYKYKFEAKKAYEQNPFAFYLAAMIREEDRDWDGAYIDFKRVYDLNPSVKYIGSDLVRSAYQARRTDMEKKWQKQFQISRNQKLNKNEGELVLIYQQGWAPRKKPHPDWPRIPKLYATESYTQKAELLVNGTSIKETSTAIYSVTDVAMKVLNDEYNSIVAQRVAGIAAKAVVSDQIRQKNELLGQLAWIGMNIADQADLRQWVTLPSTFQVAKVILPAGEHTIQIHGLSSSGSQTGEGLSDQKVTIRPGRKTFIQWRSVH